MKFVLSLIAIVACTGVAGAATFTVTSIGDSGPGSLRQAILDANADPSLDSILFNIPGGGVHTISPLTPLPSLEASVIIDGYSQPGSSSNTLASGNNAVLQVQLSGANLGTNGVGLTLLASNSTVRGLVINGWAKGILVFGHHQVIAGNFIGTDPTGSVAVGNVHEGILLSAASSCVIGGILPSDRNVISGNEEGIYITDLPGTGNRVEGNYIGVNAAGTAALGNSVHGVRINYSTGNTVGGATLGAGNLISGNGFGGIGVWYAAGTTLILGNRIGTDLAGSTAIPNGSGVGLTACSGVVVGGTNANERNLISGNVSGIAIASSSSNVIQGNFVGTDAAGAESLPNINHGIQIQGACSNNLVGVAVDGGGNVISGNGLTGVTLDASSAGTPTGNQIQGNLVGTDATGTAAVPNGTRSNHPGILVNDVAGNLIGGDVPLARNVISGNTESGIVIEGTNASGNRILGNYIGTDITGLLPLGNGLSGVVIDGAPGNRIGATNDWAELNVISGNHANGVLLTGNGASNNVIGGNYVGVSALGYDAVGNLGDGVSLSGASFNIIGWVNPAAPAPINVIAANGQNGVSISGGISNSVTANHIGTDVYASLAPPNGGSGVRIENSAGNIVQFCQIAGNLGYGIYDLGPGSVGNVLFSNHVGAYSLGTATYGNHLDGIRLENASGTIVNAVFSAGNRGNGVTMMNAPRTLLLNCRIGVHWDLDHIVELGNALFVVGNAGHGVSVQDSPNVSFLYNNVVGGNGGDGIRFDGPLTRDCHVEGTFIGLDNTSTNLLANTNNGIAIIGAPGNVIGSTNNADARNIISGNALHGILLSNANDCIIEGNYIGTDLGGTNALGNGGDGVAVVGGAGNRVGTLESAPHAGFNVISGNAGYGVRLEGGGGNFVQRDFIGLDGARQNRLGNQRGGVLVTNSSGNEFNIVTVSGNSGHGLHITGSGSFGNRVLDSWLHPFDANPANTLDGVRIENVPSDTLLYSVRIGRNGGNGVSVLNAPGTTIERCFIGNTDINTVTLPNGGHGILVLNSAGVLIGGSDRFNDGNLVGPNGGHGVYLAGSGSVSNVIKGNAIGSDFAGRAGLGNGGNGVFLEGASFNVVGYLAAEDAVNPMNIVAGNQLNGILISGGMGNLVRANHVGTDAIERLAPSNGGDGLRLENSASNQVYTSQVSGNTGHGLHIIGPGSIGNVIGTASLGAFTHAGAAYGNGLDGVRIEDAPNTFLYSCEASGNRGHGMTISNALGTLITSCRLGNVAVYTPGGPVTRPEPNAGYGLLVLNSSAVDAWVNTVGPNGGDGVRVAGSATHDVRLWLNYIGLDNLTGNPLGNAGAGIAIVDAWHNLIGHSPDRGGSTNWIANNGTGITVIGAGATANVIRRNSIYSNTNLAIDLGGDGVSLNDSSDGDAGPNLLQNFPVLTAASSGSNTVVLGTLPSMAGTVFNLDFFASPVADPSGYGEGQAFLGTTNVTTDGSGHAGFTFVSRQFVPAGQVITATATDPAGNTSEFSQAQIVTGQFRLSAQGGGTVSRNPDLAAYQSGQSVTLTATANRYYQFAGWSDGNTSAQRTVLVGATNAYVALFSNTVPLETLVFKEWDRTYGGTDYEGANAIMPTADGGFLVGGWSFSSISGNKTTDQIGQGDGWLLRLDGQGNKLWERSYGGTNTEAIQWILPTGDGGYLLAGDVSVLDPFGGYLDSDYWLVKINSAGEILWERTYGGGAVDLLLSATGTSDGGFVLVGQSSSLPSGSKTAPSYGDADYWIVKVDAAGNKLWDQSFGGGDYDAARSVVETAEGGLLVVGQAGYGASASKINAGFGNNDFWAIKLDAAGNKLWEHIYGGAGADEGYSAQPAQDGGFLLFGQSASEVAGPGNRTAPHFGSWDYWVVRIDAEGNPLWDAAYGGTDFDTCYNLTLQADGGAVLSGASLSGAGGNKTTPGYGGTDLWLVGIDAYGHRRWDYTLGGENDEYGPAVVSEADRGLVLAGYSASPPGDNKQSQNFGDQDVWVVKLATREAPLGMPAILIDHQFYPSNSATVSTSALVEIQSTISGGGILYSLDGSDPRLSPQIYTGPFTLTASAILRAIAYNDLGQASAEPDPFVLTVLSPPHFVLNPPSLTVAEGATVLISAQATGSPLLTYQWLTNGVPLPGANDPGLLLGNLSIYQAGAYQVVASNAFGMVTSAVATLRVLAPPAITAQPASHNVGTNTSVTFQVVASGSEPLTYQWRKNGANLPGATRSNLTLNSVQLADGGSYSVWVMNDVGTALGGPALLTFTNVTMLQPNDYFTNRVALAGLTNAVSGTNTGATKEPGEFNHAGFNGGHSVWYHWTAPVTGIARFRTSGSSFDTLLGIYTGTNVANLKPVVQDDDLGGFLGSAVVFNVTNGVDYAIAIDGFAGASGTFVLSWEAQLTGATVPEILVPPQGQTVRAGGAAVFSVVAGGNNLTYQWFFNGVSIPGATTPSYTNPSVQVSDVGFYAVRVSNGLNAVTTAAVVLEIGPAATLQSRDKIEELLAGSAGGGSAGNLPAGDDAFSATTVSGGFNPVLGQTTYSVIVGSTNNFGPTTNCDGSPIRYCDGYAIKSTRWLSEIGESDAGTLRLSVTNNATGRLLSVWRRASSGQPWCQIGCSNGQFQVLNTQTTFYLIGIHSTNDAEENTRLDWVFGRAPQILTNGWRTNVLARVGDNLPLTVTVTNPISVQLTNVSERLPTSYRWFHKVGDSFVSLPEQNQSNLVVAGVQLPDAGEYRVEAGNVIGTASTNVTVTVGQPPLLSVPLNDRYVPIGGALSLEPRAENRFVTGELSTDSSLSYHWLSNGVLLASELSSNLIRTNLQLTNAARYAVVVGNRFGSVTNAVQVAVGAPPGLQTSPLSLLVAWHAPALFSAMATNGAYAGLTTPPPLSYQWLFNGALLPGAEASALILPEARMNQAGDYRTVAANYFGAVTSVVASLTVHDFAMQPLAVAGGIFCLTWQGVAGKVNAVQYKDALTDPVWKDVTNNVTVTGSEIVLKEPVGSNLHRFYRVVAR